MNNIRIDWRMVGIIAVVIILATSAQVPWALRALALLGGGGYFLWYGWQRWTGRSLARRTNVTYWRGQRIELGRQRAPDLPQLGSIGPALLPLVGGGVLVLVGAALTMRALGL
jgi:hypothetical protein